MKFLKFLVVLLTIFTSFVFAYGYLNEKEVISTIVSYYDRTPTELITNKYQKEIDESFVHMTNNFIATSRQDILDIYYTIMASGMSEFTFFCDNDYKDCINEVLKVNDDQELLSQINNFVHVYNSFKTIKTTYTTNGKITLYINRTYSENDIEKINKRLDELENKIIDKSKNERDNIKEIHDYIINNTKYNVEDENKTNTESSSALGVFFNNLATCNGYTDATSLLLDRLGVKNVRISNDDHIWNLVYLDGKWLHLDVTWDDPVNNLNKDMLLYDYFLKETSEMDAKHNYNKEIFDFI